MQMDDDTRRAIDKIEKLMRLAGANPNEAEASAALAKAQELLVAYNLTMAVVEQASGQSGKRLQEMVAGGMHKYQRKLWRYIAELNFCMYWTQKNQVRDGSVQAKRGRRHTHEHRLVGRTVNVSATRGMALYLDHTIERLCREMLGGDAHKSFYSRDAVAFREGIADRVIEKIIDRRDEMVAREERDKAAAAKKAAEQGLSLATTLTVAGLTEAERDANMDFIHGEGHSARERQRNAEWEAGREERRQRQAAADAAAERAYSQWAQANPKEAAKEAAKERARERRRATSNGDYRRYRYRQTEEDMRKDTGSYRAGYAKGEGVSIDPQVEPKDQRRIAR